MRSHMTIRKGMVKYWDVFLQQWDTKSAHDLLTAQSGSGNYLMPTFSVRDRERIAANVFDK
jgi:hypothetical protein